MMQEAFVQVPTDVYNCGDFDLFDAVETCLEKSKGRVIGKINLRILSTSV